MMPSRPLNASSPASASTASVTSAYSSDTSRKVAMSGFLAAEVEIDRRHGVAGGTGSLRECQHQEPVLGDRPDRGIDQVEPRSGRTDFKAVSGFADMCPLQSLALKRCFRLRTDPPK